jgi:catechol 2,3-dioxygenase-like lactoylglutathione lyase family enzyme
MKIEALLHAGLIVSDLDRARDFYENVLGLVPSPSRPSFDFNGMWYDIGAAQIHLMVMPDPDAASVRPEHGGRDRHIALAVDDLAAVKAALEAAGVPYTPSRSGRAALFCRDPDRNALEFVQR